VAIADPWAGGGAGCEEAAGVMLHALGSSARFRLLYPDELPLREKIETVAREIYRAGQVVFQPAAAARLAAFEEQGFGRLPVCIAKTQYSFTDDPDQWGAPTGHTLTIRDAHMMAGAGFVVAYTGSIVTMPGLPRRPAAEKIDVAEDGSITGLT
jgi:formate--tetrahydrofolate ligase